MGYKNENARRALRRAFSLSGSKRLKFSGSCKCRFGALGNPGESLGIFDCDFRQDTAVQGDTGFFKAADKSTIGDVIQTGGSSQSDDKQAAKIALLCPPVR